MTLSVLFYQLTVLKGRRIHSKLDKVEGDDNMGRHKVKENTFFPSHMLERRYREAYGGK